ncbi:prepilin peptidase [Streptomyces sp. H27-C3]|uniref:prepilin peptidase n=1 Tax=Streptomyces sp. H27-C3 TaxID=3046305 RepID=UPI0024B87FC0|nr:prepilin peptidase [Streptomyces sp. H27-C3]MDJ0464400.1 prepilin peptidase [Streptomyces sp. H27-C3]
MPYLALIVGAVLWGAAAGLLIPRAGYRFSVEPETPWRTDCPDGHPITGPAGGWLGRARCAEDGAVYGRPAPALVATALVCGLLAAGTGARPELAVWLLLAPFAVLLAHIDFAVHRLPDVLTLPLAGAGALLLGGAALLPEHAGSWPAALLGGLALGGGYFVLFLINPRGMGFGDVKLALVVGVVLGWYGWAVLFAGAFAGLLLGAVYGLGLVVAGRAGRKSALPLGPFMICGALFGVLLGGLAG